MNSSDYDNSENAQDSACLFGRVLDGKGGGRPISWKDAQAWAPASDSETLWLHLDRTKPEALTLLQDTLRLPAATVDILISNETRPRAFREDDALITILRGINFNDGQDPEDMIAMQIWADERRVITLRRRRLQTPRDVLDEIEKGRGPKTAGDLVADIVEQLAAKMSRAIVNMNERIDRLEQTDPASDVEGKLDEISGIRRNCLALQRFMSPQHEALTQISHDPPAFMSEENKKDVREAIDRLRRYLDDLNVSKESALVIQDDLNNRATNQSNRTMYMLSIVAAIFLPLGFITGLLGINVGGMPGVDSEMAFWVTVGLLTALLGVQLYVFRKLKWL